mgnify:CR=1 FL=1
MLDGSTPSAVSLAAECNYLYLAARAMDGSIWHRRMSTAGAWSGWSRVLGFTDVSPAIAVYNNRLYLVCKQSGAQSIWYAYVDISSYPSGWYGWYHLNGLTPDALTLASSSDYLYFVARSTDNSIWYRTMDLTGSWSGWSPASGYTESPVAIAVFNWYMHLAARQAGANNQWIYK